MWSMGSMGLFWILILVAIVALVWYLLAASRGTPPSSSPESPVDLLKRRYARGEIDEETYEKMLHNLKK